MSISESCVVVTSCFDREEEATRDDADVSRYDDDEDSFRENLLLLDGCFSAAAVAAAAR